ncbi:hypothetical protein ES703_71037 [subsurface metagenome]
MGKCLLQGIYKCADEQAAIVNVYQFNHICATVCQYPGDFIVKFFRGELIWYRIITQSVFIYEIILRFLPPRLLVEDKSGGPLLPQQLIDIDAGVHRKCIDRGIGFQAKGLHSRFGHPRVDFDHINATSRPDLLNVSRKDVAAASDC